MRTVTPAQLGIVGLFSVAALSAAAIGLSGAAQADPPGNNGTIKVDGVAFDSAPDNEPHPGCTFEIDWYGYDKGDYYSDVTFEAIPPTTRPDTKDQVLKTDHVFVGEDDASGAATPAGLDASVKYTLDFTGIEPQPQQGFHVKLTITAPKSNGAETKFKVFWVKGCDEPNPTPTTTSPTPTTTAPTPTTTSPTTPPTTSTPPLTTPPTSPTSTTSTTTTPPTPCESESDDDDCGVVTTPPALAG